MNATKNRLNNRCFTCRRQILCSDCAVEIIQNEKKKLMKRLAGSK